MESLVEEKIVDSQYVQYQKPVDDLFARNHIPITASNRVENIKKNCASLVKEADVLLKNQEMVSAKLDALLADMEDFHVDLQHTMKKCYEFASNGSSDKLADFLADSIH